MPSTTLPVKRSHTAAQPVPSSGRNVRSKGDGISTSSPSTRRRSDALLRRGSASAQSPSLTPPQRTTTTGTATMTCSSSSRVGGTQRIRGGAPTPTTTTTTTTTVVSTSASGRGTTVLRKRPALQGREVPSDRENSTSSVGQTRTVASRAAAQPSTIVLNRSHTPRRAQPASSSRDATTKATTTTAVSGPAAVAVAASGSSSFASPLCPPSPERPTGRSQSLCVMGTAFAPVGSSGAFSPPRQAYRGAGVAGGGTAAVERDAASLSRNGSTSAVSAPGAHRLTLSSHAPPLQPHTDAYVTSNALDSSGTLPSVFPHRHAPPLNYTAVTSGVAMEGDGSGDSSPLRGVTRPRHTVTSSPLAQPRPPPPAPPPFTTDHAMQPRTPPSPRVPPSMATGSSSATRHHSRPSTLPSQESTPQGPPPLRLVNSGAAAPLPTPIPYAMVSSLAEEKAMAGGGGTTTTAAATTGATTSSSSQGSPVHPTRPVMLGSPLPPPPPPCFLVAAEAPVPAASPSTAPQKTHDPPHAQDDATHRTTQPLKQQPSVSLLSSSAVEPAHSPHPPPSLHSRPVHGEAHPSEPRRPRRWPSPSAPMINLMHVATEVEMEEADDDDSAWSEASTSGKPTPLRTQSHSVSRNRSLPTSARVPPLPPPQPQPHSPPRRHGSEDHGMGSGSGAARLFASISSLIPYPPPPSSAKRSAESSPRSHALSTTAKDQHQPQPPTAAAIGQTDTVAKVVPADRVTAVDSVAVTVPPPPPPPPPSAPSKRSATVNVPNASAMSGGGNRKEPPLVPVEAVAPASSARPAPPTHAPSQVRHPAAKPTTAPTLVSPPRHRCVTMEPTATNTARHSESITSIPSQQPPHATTPSATPSTTVTHVPSEPAPVVPPAATADPAPAAASGCMTSPTTAPAPAGKENEQTVAGSSRGRRIPLRPSTPSTTTTITARKGFATPQPARVRKMSSQNASASSPNASAASSAAQGPTRGVSSPPGKRGAAGGAAGAGKAFVAVENSNAGDQGQYRVRALATRSPRLGAVTTPRAMSCSPARRASLARKAAGGATALVQPNAAVTEEQARRWKERRRRELYAWNEQLRKQVEATEEAV